MTIELEITNNDFVFVSITTPTIRDIRIGCFMIVGDKIYFGNCFWVNNDMRTPVGRGLLNLDHLKLTEIE
jgi:hypothetical protein